MKKTQRVVSGLAMSIVLAVGAPLVLLSGCAGSQDPLGAVPQRIIQKPGKAQLEVTDTDSGAALVVERAQVLIVNLPLWPADSQEWSLGDMKPGVLTLTGSKFERDKRDRDGVASPGQMMFELKPQAAGDLVLNFSLRRPHSLDPATQTVTYAVTVR